MALYQQGVQKIEIIIRKDGGGGGSGGQGNRQTDPDNASKPKTWRTTVFGSENKQRINRVIKTNITHAVAVTKQVVDLQIEYKVGGIGYENGDQSLQQNVSRQIEVVKDATNVVSSIAMGGVYGAWGGPIGAVAGMALAGVSTSMSLLSKYKNRERDYNMKVFKQENAISYKRARAQLNLTTGRLR